MAVSINDGALVWTARIDDSKLPEDIKKLQAVFSELQVDFINEDATAATLKKVQENVVVAQKEIFNIQEASNAKLNSDLITSAAITQDRITDIVVEETKIRANASREEAQALLNSNLPVQTTGLPGRPTQKQTQIDDILGDDVSKQLREAENLYGQLDQATKEYVAELVELEIELKKVDDAQKKLNKASREGKISNDDYINGTNVLAARQKEIADSIQLITKRQKEFDAATANDITSINGKKEVLKQLVAQYKQLSEAERVSTQGKQLAQSIKSVTTELQQLKRAGTAGFDELGNAITRQVGLLEKLKRQAEIYKAGIQQATLPANIAKYNQKLEQTNLQIAKLSNTGKKGLEGIGIETEKLTKKTNILSKGWAFFRQAAFLIPGLGIAGIFNLIGEGIASLVSKLFKATSSIKTFGQISNDIRENSIKGYAKEVSKLEILRKVLTDRTASLTQRNKAIDEYNEIADKSNQIDKKFIDNSNLIESAINRQIELIKERALARAAESIIAEKAEALFLAQQQARVHEQERFDADVEAGQIVTAERYDALTKRFIKNNDQVLEADKERIISGRVAATEAVKNAEKELEASLKAGLPFIKNGQAEVIIKKQKKENDELNSLLEKRKRILQSIIDLERDALQSGLVKQASEIDKINERREKEIRLLKETNAAIDKYNAKHKVNIARIGQAEIDRINRAADTLIKNATYKKDAEEYLEAIKEKRKAFDEFQKAQQTGNTLVIEQAREANKKQLGDFENFVDLLKSEYDRLFESLSFDGSDDIGAVTRFEGIKKMLDDAVKASGEEQVKFTQEQFRDLLQQTETFAQKRFEINKKYNDLEATLEKEKGLFSPEELQARRKIIEDGRKEEITELENDIVRQSALYKRLSQDIVRFTRKMLKDEAKDLENFLKKNTSITPQMKADIQARVNELKGLLDSTNEVAERFTEFGEGLSKVGGIFNDMASAVEGVDDELAKVLSTLGSVANIAGDAAKAIASFATGDIIGGVSSAIGAIGGIFSIGKKAREERKRHQQEIQDFLAAQFAGEQEINLLIQERERAQVRINKLRLEGIESEKALLIQQRDVLKGQFQTVFDELQKQTFKALVQIPAMFGGLQDVIVDTPLFGKTFDEIEQLFLKGQLEGKAKELFETLNKLKDAGLDIDKILAENKKEAQELFTGTTADSIVDTIAQGFADGKRSAADFADTFETFMQQALINSLKFKVLEGPLTKFFEDFAAASESDSTLTNAEIDRLKATYNSIIDKAADQFEQLQQLAGINFDSTDSQQNTLKGAIKGMTEQQAELLAGQFGGLRITAIEHLRVAMRGIESLQNIEANTARLIPMYDLWRRIELDGLKVK